jgi:uncharacterized protein
VKFDWDENKNLSNYRKHGVWFEEAQTIWADEYAIEFYDSEHSSVEDRYIRIGHSTSSALLLVIFCERNGDTIRIVSARKATSKERKEYEEGI